MKFIKICLQQIFSLSCLIVCNADIRIRNPENVTIEVTLQDEEAAFGSHIPLLGITGYIVEADPPEACSLIAPPPGPSFHGWTHTFIALIRRSRPEASSSSSNCTFDVKVLNAQKSGYQAAVVYNVGSELTFVMEGGAQAPLVRIPSVFIGASNGELLKDQYSYLSNFTVTIMPDEDDFQLAFYFLPFIVVFGGSLVATVIFVLVLKFRDRRRAQRERLSRADLNAYPTCKYSSTNPETARYDCCAICLEDYVENDRLRILPCSHAYHSRCIDEWLLKKKRVCPVCKQPIQTRREARQLERNPRSVSVNPSNLDEAEDPANERTPLLASGTQREAYSQPLLTVPVPVHRALNTIRRDNYEQLTNEEEELTARLNDATDVDYEPALVDANNGLVTRVDASTELGQNQAADRREVA